MGRLGLHKYIFYVAKQYLGSDQQIGVPNYCVLGVNNLNINKAREILYVFCELYYNQGFHFEDLSCKIDLALPLYLRYKKIQYFDLLITRLLREQHVIKENLLKNKWVNTQK